MLDRDHRGTRHRAMPQMKRQDPEQAIDREQPGADPVTGNEERAAGEEGRSSLFPKPPDCGIRGQAPR